MPQKKAQIKESAPPPRGSEVHEWVDLSEATLDTEEYIVRGARIIRAGWSENQRYYSDSVLDKAAPLWEGVKAYADHPSKDERRSRPERSVRDIVGYYSNPRHANGQTLADFKVLGEARQWLWPLVKETLDTGVPVVGLSIHAYGSGRKGEADGKKGLVVEAITHADSVDVVTQPAAGGGFPLIASDDGWSKAVIDGLTKEDLRESRPDLFDDLKREWKSTRDTTAVKEARAEAAQHEAALATLTEEHRTTQAALQEAQAQIARLERERTVDRLLAGRTMPDEVRTELREELLSASDESAMLDSIERTLKVLGAIRLPVRVTEAGRARQPQAPAGQRLRRNVAAEVFNLPAALVEAETIDEYVQAKQTLLTGA